MVTLGFALVAFALAFLLVPRVHWRTEVVWLKASGALQDISWGELWQLSRHGDPFNVRELAKTPNPYMVIKNPLTSTADLAAGRATFQAHCAVCHGAGGAGDKIGTLPPFPGSRLFAGKRVPQATAFLDRRGEGGKHSGLSAAS